MINTKKAQLRVRVTSAQRETLENIAQKRGKEETISDVLRELIVTARCTGQPNLILGEGIATIVGQLCQETNRTADQVIADCIAGIWDMVETGESPLIVEEIRLRRKYRKKADAVEAARMLVPGASQQ